MELRAWAETVLFGQDLAAKTTLPGPIRDRSPGPALSPPRVPGRPRSLRLSRSTLKFDLESEQGRGEVLHAFANHELLALELMALVLLRFPDAPPAYRRGLASTMRDEQAHLLLYLERMEACGVALGDVPVSGFFWETLRDVPSVEAFAAAMSLGFEQANLDFSRHWRDAFRAAGDGGTAEVLDRVYVDEIRHVAQGRVWLQRWTEPEELFEAWSKRLPAPLTPARAKGPVFDREGRERAGLSDAFIDKVRVFAHSKGRTPRVYWFDPACEARMASRGAYTPPRAVADLTHDLAFLMAAVAADDDVVVAPEPTAAFLDDLRRAGLSVPQRVASLDDLGGRRLDSLHPWGWSPAALPELEVARAPMAWDPAWKRQFARNSVLGHACRSLAEVEACEVPFVVKAPYSAAGRERVFSPLDERSRGWIQNTLRSQGLVWVEPWLDKVLDLSVQAEGNRVLGVTRFETDARGKWLGSYVGPWTQGLPVQVARFVHGEGKRPGWVEAALVAEAKKVGWWGPYGIDALIHRTEAGLQLLPRLELNPRYTMGRLAWALRARLPNGWLRIRDKGVPLEPVFSGGRLVAGRLALTDPALARRVIAVFEVDPRDGIAS